MKEELKQIQENALLKINESLEMAALENVRVQFLGKAGELTKFLRGMGSLPAEERPAIGQIVNNVRAELEEALAIKKEKLQEKEIAKKLESEFIDITEPGKRPVLGSLHPMSIVIDELSDIFISMGYEIASGPEIETVFNNFDALNSPENHPSRSEQDTFYIDENTILRTQTSPVQIRKMKEGKLPIAIIAPGKVFRVDEVDATHSPVFHQLEGLVVDKGLNMGHLKGAIEAFVVKLFGEGTKIRFRPHYFPFTEPSAEVDISCFSCGGDDSKCSVCRGEGYIELLGCGMVHPKVLQNCGIDPDIYSGFAFGMGLERLAMQRYKIDDMRLLFENDVQFLKQFS